ncbi:F0F1 ATP synthase subunit B family protein [Fodinicurvata sediminis]|uniref:F0F1 ATP synthase subunit B family protein n=1 Tax=Fodinicurvata sediminis TaxID=1121832 RepID=UPI0003B680C6|nr:F0F1 ATP synthase subunit B [Fodinicurvata sediminis]
MFSSEYTWITIALLLFLALAAWKGLRPMLAKLDSRSERIRKEIEEAQALREEAQKMLADYKRRQRDALKEAEEIVEHSKTEAQRIRQNSEKELEESLQRREQMMMDKIRQAEADAIAEVRNQAVDVAIAASAKLIADNLDKEGQKALTESSIETVGNKLN